MFSGRVSINLTYKPSGFAVPLTTVAQMVDQDLHGPDVIKAAKRW